MVEGRASQSEKSVLHEQGANRENQAEREHNDENAKLGVVRQTGRVPGIEQLGQWRKEHCHQQECEPELAEPLH